MTWSVRDEEDFEPTYDEDEIVEIRKGDLRAVLDVATQSMDFGSGFLDNEQVEALRKGAVSLGIDPMIVTPANFTCTYGEGHEWEWQPTWAGGAWFCSACRHVDTDRGPPEGWVRPDDWPQWARAPRANLGPNQEYIDACRAAGVLEHQQWWKDAVQARLAATDDPAVIAIDVPPNLTMEDFNADEQGG